MSFLKKFSHLLRKYRISKGFSQEKLAEFSELDRTYISLLERGLRSPTITTLYKISHSLGFNLSDFFRELEESIFINKEKNIMHSYIINNSTSVSVNNKVILSNDQIVNAIHKTNKNLEKLSHLTQESGVEVFEALGMRNLSGFIGEFFVSSLEKVSNGLLIKNPHQDGYPDLLLVDSPEAQLYYKTLVTYEGDKIYPKEKSLFSPFKYGGLEVKATCGSTPPASKVPKPLIGEQRIKLLTSFDWKAHHRETNNLIGIYWDFINGLPIICSVFFRNDLNENDWGNIVQPRKGGGRTTSVSIMKANGVKKMCENWIAIIDDDLYIEKLSNKKWIGYNVKN